MLALSPTPAGLQDVTRVVELLVLLLSRQVWLMPCVPVGRCSLYMACGGMPRDTSSSLGSSVVKEGGKGEGEDAGLWRTSTHKEEEGYSVHMAATMDNTVHSGTLLPLWREPHIVTSMSVLQHACMAVNNLLPNPNCLSASVRGCATNSPTSLQPMSPAFQCKAAQQHDVLLNG